MLQHVSHVLRLPRQCKPFLELDRGPRQLARRPRPRKVDLQVVARVVHAARRVGAVGGFVPQVGVVAPADAVGVGQLAGALSLVEEE